MSLDLGKKLEEAEEGDNVLFGKELHNSYMLNDTRNVFPKYEYNNIHTQELITKYNQVLKRCKHYVREYVYNKNEIIALKKKLNDSPLKRTILI